MCRFITVLFALVAGSTCFAGPESLPSGKEMAVSPAPAPPACSWTGIYVGLRIGYGGQWHDVRFDPSRSPGDFGYYGDDVSVDSDGVIGGGALGYNYQLGRFVLGAEADFSGADVSGNGVNEHLRSVGPNGYDPDASDLFAHEDIDWFGTVRGRIGYLVSPCLLFYGTGGFAYVDRTLTGDLDVFQVGAYHHFGKWDGVVPGWTAGAGLEWKLDRHWSVKVEYLYLDARHHTAHGLETSDGFTYRYYAVDYTGDTELHTGSVGLNYQF